MKFKVNYFNGWYDQVKELDEIVSNQLGLSHEFIEKHKSTRKGEIVTRMQVVSHIARAAYKVKGVQLSAYFERDHACINNNGRRVEGWIDVKDQAFINLLTRTCQQAGVDTDIVLRYKRPNRYAS
jgi:hypothetical protein